MEYAEAQVSMTRKDIEIGLVAIDEASGVVAAASIKSMIVCSRFLIPKIS